MSSERRIIEHEHNPVFGTPPLIFHEQRPHESAELSAAVKTASNEIADRDSAYLRAMNAPTAPKLEPPRLRSPALPDDFVDRIDALDEAMFKRGVAVSRDRLVSLGKQRFEDLLRLDREARSSAQRVIGTTTDLSCFGSIFQAFTVCNALVTSARPRKPSEVFSGKGADREAASKIDGFSDLWKTISEPVAVRSVYAFHDAFASLVLAQSLLERLSHDGRVRSRFLCGGKGGDRVRRFREWLSVLDGPHFSVMLVDPLGALLVWLANEKTEPPSTDDLAKAWFNVRAPTNPQLRIAEAAWHGFLLGHSSWTLWNFVGNKTRAQLDVNVVETWRAQLAKSYRAITAFHDQMRAAFFKPVSDAQGGHFQLDEKEHRQFIDAHVRFLSNRLSAIIAMAVEETIPQSVCARFEDFILCARTNDVKHKATLDARIYSKLQTAFPSSNFEFRIEGAV
jgi:hypothetical protein